jgi:hypothetical protein
MTSVVPAELRRLVMRRANGQCEYCLIREDDSAFNLQVEHIISEKHGGATSSDNLACSCVFCNRFKGSDIASVSPTTGQLVRLFHPRRDRWADHFQIDGALIVPVTEIGEATARLLRVNADDRILERSMLQASGRYPKQAPSS